MHGPMGVASPRCSMEAPNTCGRLNRPPSLRFRAAVYSTSTPFTALTATCTSDTSGVGSGSRLSRHAFATCDQTQGRGAQRVTHIFHTRPAYGGASTGKPEDVQVDTVHTSLKQVLVGVAHKAVDVECRVSAASRTRVS